MWVKVRLLVKVHKCQNYLLMLAIEQETWAGLQVSERLEERKFDFIPRQLLTVADHVVQIGSVEVGQFVDIHFHVNEVAQIIAVRV